MRPRTREINSSILPPLYQEIEHPKIRFQEKTKEAWSDSITSLLK